MWPWSRAPRPGEPLAYAETAGAAYSELIEAELSDEAERRASIERRGIQITTGSGVVATVALAAWPSITGAHLIVPAEALWFGAAAAIALTVGVVCGHIAHAPTAFDVVKAIALTKLMTPEFWDVRRSIGSRRATEVRLEELISARKANSIKATWLQWGYALLVVGIVCLGAAGILIVGFNPIR